MDKKRQYLGKWELGCMVFNACIHKIFTDYPRKFGEISGSASWLTALFSGLVFLGLLWLLLTFVPRKALRPDAREGGVPKNLLRLLLAVYWLASAVYALRGCVLALRAVAYPRSPGWFLALFLALGAAVPAVCGARAVYRIHSLTVLPVGLAAGAIALLGLKYANPLYLAPVLGTGPVRVFGRGLSTLFLYSDILFVFQLARWRRPEVRVRRTVITAAALAVLTNVSLLLVSSMAQPSQLSGSLSIPIYPLTKAAYFGYFWSRLDAAYLAALTVSSMLYLAMALLLLKVSLRGPAPGRRPRRVTAALLCLALPLTLTGCFDRQEVEEGAYLVALGVDKGQQAPYRYTFQLSNPLDAGDGQISGQDPDAASEDSGDKGNQSVSHIQVEAENFYLALNRLKSHLSKAPELAHVKLVVFSKELAREGLLDHTSLLLKERELRPNTKLCLADSAQAFLAGVKPTLEQSTARYYELLFRNENTPYAPVTDLASFVSQCTDSAQDPALPLADTEKLMGIGIFSGESLVQEGSPREAVLYKLLTGQARQIALPAGNSDFWVTSRGRPEVRVDFQTDPPSVTVSPRLSARLIHGNRKDCALLQDTLEREMTAFIRTNAQEGRDPLGLGRWARQQFLTWQAWEAARWPSLLPSCHFLAKTTIKLDESV